MEEALAVGVVVVLVGGVVVQWLAWRFRVPAIVLLLAVGLLAGPGFGIIHPSHAMGRTLGPLVGLAVSIVVLAGGLALNQRERRAAGARLHPLPVVALRLASDVLVLRGEQHQLAGLQSGRLQGHYTETAVV